ncbi:hypothetical protein BDF20DRAFT_112532 [Mycotypha africana]|uniref:uncharacterized protein n=1 Tax=Mycotypha africana TaxID=64632 RepID=UPI002301F3BE|nr:uncharacterized protein BDF20DRAFT_112532 [Mycotypha africana]KAI8970220.1 hypothetical protein BDF20DRAFT_112532 [Mycotypha africana]
MDSYRKKKSSTINSSALDNEKKSVKQQQLPIQNLSSSEDAWLPAIKRRRRFTAEETRVLEKEYEKNSSPNQEMIQAIANRISTPRKIVTTWFQNRRAKNKRKEKRVEEQQDSNYQQCQILERNSGFPSHATMEVPPFYAPCNEIMEMQILHNDIDYPNYCAFDSFLSNQHSQVNYIVNNNTYIPPAATANSTQQFSSFASSPVDAYQNDHAFYTTNSYDTTTMYDLSLHPHNMLYLPFVPLLDEHSVLHYHQLSQLEIQQQPSLINTNSITAQTIDSTRQQNLFEHTQFNASTLNPLPTSSTTNTSISTAITEILTNTNTEYPLYVNPTELCTDRSAPICKRPEHISQPE